MPVQTANQQTERAQLYADMSPSHLTPLWEVLHALAEGLAYKQIAAQLNVSIHTVRSYIRRMYEKLHVRSRTEAVVKYLKRADG